MWPVYKVSKNPIFPPPPKKFHYKMCFKRPSHLNQMEDILHNITDTFEMSESGVFCPNYHRAKINPLKQGKNLFCLSNNIYIFICKKLHISAYTCTCMYIYFTFYCSSLQFFITVLSLRMIALSFISSKWIEDVTESAEQITYAWSMRNVFQKYQHHLCFKIKFYGKMLFRYQLI